MKKKNEREAQSNGNAERSAGVRRRGTGGSWVTGKENNQTDRREKVITTVTEGKQIERRFKRKAGKRKCSTEGSGEKEKGNVQVKKEKKTTCRGGERDVKSR